MFSTFDVPSSSLPITARVVCAPPSDVCSSAWCVLLRVAGDDVGGTRIGQRVASHAPPGSARAVYAVCEQRARFNGADEAHAAGASAVCKQLVERAQARCGTIRQCGQAADEREERLREDELRFRVPPAMMFLRVESFDFVLCCML